MAHDPAVLADADQPPERTCGTCRFGRPSDKGILVTCFRFPPSVAWSGIPRQTVTLFPTPSMFWVCGEHAPREREGGADG